MIEDFWNELNEGDIHTRDNLQFELKSEFFINPLLKHNFYKQEVYMFIPNALQINSETYSKQQFYLDQTNLIRYKTPLMRLSDLGNLFYPLSPLARLYHLLQSNPNESHESISDELKLFGAIFRGAVREWVYDIVKSINNLLETEKLSKKIVHLCSEISLVCHRFRTLQMKFHPDLDSRLVRHFKYIDEFISTMIDEFLVILLKQYRSSKMVDQETDEILSQLVIEENFYRQKKNLIPKSYKGEKFANESTLYRQGLLHRFVLESLMLKHIRFSPEEKHRHVLGAFAAGIAMLIYMILFVWQISTFVINSFPFVASAVFFYILKDRIKEGFKTFYSKQAHRWFPDYSTEITNFKDFKVGNLSESFVFIDLNQLPEEILKVRNYDFHEELQALQRHETIFQYKREFKLNSPNNDEVRRREVTTFFRFNIHHFLQKVSNAFQTHLYLDPETKEITEGLLPKIYHLNLIIHNTIFHGNVPSKEEIKTFRVVLDKNGIKRVEQIVHKENPHKPSSDK